MSSYSRQSPFLAKLKERHRLNSAGSTKETWHVVVSLEGSDIRYRPGDSMGICPENDHEMCKSLLASLGCSEDEQIEDPRTKEVLQIGDFLRRKANLSVPTRKLVQELAIRGASLDQLLQPEHDERFHEYIKTNNVLELLQAHPEAKLGPQDLVQNLGPLLPRLYSIASSELEHPNEVHFTVSRVRYELHGKKRLGIASHFLCDMIKPNKDPVPVYLQQTKDFLLPEDNQRPILMIGPGTGVAPFRSFMQERLKRPHPTHKNWLFFGERHSTCDFFYEPFWKELINKGHLRLTSAFSRDQEEKIYVQHRLWQERKEVWQWIQEGANIYVCGDANQMAKDVDQCLQNIIKEALNISDESARHFMTDLRKQKRYLRDVY